MKVSPVIARTAAKWWADRLRQGRDAVHDPETSEIDTVIMTVQAQAAAKPLRQIDAFEASLCRVLEADFPITGMRVDRDPDPILREAADAVGAEGIYDGLPWEASMSYYVGWKALVVKEGYGCEWVRVAQIY